MECPECHGEGRILLFTSSKECGSCKGTGTHQGAPETAQSAGAPDPPAMLQSAYDSGRSITLTGGTGASPSGGDIYITTGSSTLGGGVTLSAGDVTGTSGDNWYVNTGNTGRTVDTGTAALSLGGGGGSSFDFLTGTKQPTDLEAPLGSMYMCDDDGVGSLWVKTSEGPDGWAQLATHAGGPDPTSDDVTDAIDSVLNAGMGKDALIDYVASQLEVRQEVHRRSQLQGSRGMGQHRIKEWIRHELKDFPNIGEPIPAMAPVSTNIIADMMAMIEQRGQEVVAFISSSRDFADIRKYGDATGLKWEGRNVSYYDVPIWHSHKIRPGNMVAVADDRRLAMCTITR